MDNYKKTWQKNFEEKAKGDSSTLVPSEHIFENVKKAIFEKKKRRRLLWLWMFAGVSVIVVLYASYQGVQGKLVNQTTEQASSTTNVGEKGSILRIDQDQISNLVAEDKRSKATLKNNGIEKNDKVNTQKLSIPTVFSGQDDFASHASESISMMHKANDSPSLKDGNNENVTTDKSLAESHKLMDNVSSSSEVKQNALQPVISQSTITMLSEDARVMSEKLGRHQIGFTNVGNSNTNNIKRNTNRIFENISKIDLQKTNTIQVADQNTLDLPELTQIKIIQSDFNSGWRLDFGASYGDWRDNLNKDYETALNPADFYLSSKSVVGVFSRISRTVNQKISLGLGGGVNFVRSTSGHNSSSTYIIEDETTPFISDQNFMLGTPYGLLESNISFKRNPSVLENQELRLTVMTDHAFNNYFLDVSMFFDIIQHRSWNLRLMLGPRINFISQLDNDVTVSLVDGSGVTIDNVQLISDQQHVNSTFFSLFGRCDLSYQLNAKWSFVVAGEWSEGLTPMFKNQSFGSNARTINATLGLGLRL